MNRIFCKFHELAFIREINLQRKLIHRHVIRIFMYSYVQYTKWRCTNTSGMLPVHGSLSVRMPPEAISSAKWEMSALIRQDTGKNSKTINTTRGRYSSFSAMKSLSFLITSQSLSRCYGFMWWTRLISPIMEAWVLCHLSLPLPLHIVFEKILFAKSNFYIKAWNI